MYKLLYSLVLYLNTQGYYSLEVPRQLTEDADMTSLNHQWIFGVKVSVKIVSTARPLYLPFVSECQDQPQVTAATRGNTDRSQEWQK